MPPAGNIYEILVQNVIDYAICMLDPEGRITSWNPGAQRIKGYTAAEIIGEHFSRFYTEEDRASGQPGLALKTAVQAGRFASETWRVRKDGSRFWAMVVIDPIYQDGALIGFAKITRDITEQRRAQLVAIESERRFRLLVQSVTDYAIFMLSPDGVVTNWNAGAERIKGYAASEIVGEHFSRFYTPEDIAANAPKRALERAHREGRYEAEGWRCRKDGTRFWASVVVDAIYEEDGELIGFAKITRDLTERREVQLQLEQSREQLFQAQKMEAVGQLTGGVAHDLNNLLTGIMGSLELLSTRIAQGRTGNLERYITGAHGAATRAAALIHRMLAFARRQTLDPRPTDVNKLIVDVDDLTRRTVSAGVTVVTNLAPDLWTTLCDPNQLESVLLNLCINARDAMPDGGQLTIETSMDRLDKRRARVRDMQLGEYVVVSVTDTGTGMPTEVLARAFDPFFTTKPIGHGTGLGLSMVYGFARQSGGAARIYSELGTGTTVRIYLPRHLGPAEDAAENAPATPPWASRDKSGHTMLVVDDEPTVRMLVTEALEELGHSVLAAADGESALKILRSGARIDLLITDIGLPDGVNGREMADEARQVRPGVKVLFMTGYDEGEALATERPAPAVHMLSKPFAIEKLASKVEAILAEGEPDRTR